MMTPIIIDENIKKLLSFIPSDSEAFYVPVVPEDYAKPTFCFPSVEEKIKRNGGNILYGWQIWKTQILVEAEFHAVWKSEIGECIDITPKQIPTNKILFKPDINTPYCGIQIDNIRLNITTNTIVDDLILISKALFRHTNKGNYAYQTGMIKFIGKDAQIFETLSKIKSCLLFMIGKGKTRNDLCFCGSGLQYKECHEVDIREGVKFIL